MIVGPASRSQITIQAAERLRELGAGVPWEVCPPLPPRLIAWLCAVPGMTPEMAYVVLAVLAFSAASWAVYRLWRVMGAGVGLALQAAALSLLAPSGWIAILERGEIDRLLFWKLLPFVFLAIDVFRRKPSKWRLVLIGLALAVMALTRSERLIAFDALALAEWVVLFVACPPWATGFGRARIAAAAVFVLAAWARMTLAKEPGALAPMPAALVAQASKPAVGPVSLEARLDPARRRAHELINSELRPHESLLWLQALGARSAVAPAHGKFARYLECIAEQDGWCEFDTATPAPPAVLVSRQRFDELKPIRGLFDLEGLERYLSWAMRPEAVGFERDGDRIRVHADSGPDDLILVRVAARDWLLDADSNSSYPASDPLGFAVLDGAGTFTLRFAAGARLGGRPEAIHLDDGDYPRILPEGVVEATAYRPPPFEPGAHVSIFGERFRPDASHALIDGVTAPLDYASSAQLNLRLPADIAPGPHELVINSANRFSYPYRFEVTRP